MGLSPRERQWKAEEGAPGAMLVFIGGAERSSQKDWVEAVSAWALGLWEEQ